MSSQAIVFMATAVIVPLLLSEFGDWCPWLAKRLVLWSARRLGDSQAAERYTEEWLAELEEVPGKLSRVIVAMSKVLALPRSRWVLRRIVAAQEEEDEQKLRAEQNREAREPTSTADALRAIREQLANSPSKIGLYTAISQLPPRECDVVVLRYVLGYDVPSSATFMAMDQQTIEHHERRARERLRVTLSLPPISAPSDHC